MGRKRQGPPFDHELSLALDRIVDEIDRLGCSEERLTRKREIEDRIWAKEKAACLTAR